MSEKGYCKHCEAPIPTGQGRRRYCSNACKQAAHRQRHRRASLCSNCGQALNGASPYCSTRCYYYDNRHQLPHSQRSLTAWDEELIPFVPIGLQAAIDLNRPPWHAWVYGGSRCGR